MNVFKFFFSFWKEDGGAEEEELARPFLRLIVFPWQVTVEVQGKKGTILTANLSTVRSTT